VKIQSDAIKTALKFVGVMAATMAGSLGESDQMLAGIAGAVSVACMALTVSGLTRADIEKTSLKLGSMVAATLAGSLQATQPQAFALLMALSAALAAVTVPAPGTAAKIERASVAPKESKP
jgi:hypothetical protein